MTFFKYLSQFLSLFFPQFCVGCRKQGVLLCESCEIQMRFNDSQERQKHDEVDRLFVLSPYQDNRLLQALIKRLKYYGAFDVARVCGKLLSAFLEKQNLPKDFVITSVPLHWRRFLERGFNQSELIAKELGQNQTLLKRVKYTQQQAKLHKIERIHNVHKAFQFIGKEVPERVLLVDDVASTCSTLNECAKVLKKAGVKEVWAIVLARNI